MLLLENLMNTPYQQAEQLLTAMTRAEKAQLLQWVVCDLGDSFNLFAFTGRRRNN